MASVNASDIKFSLRPLTLRDMVLLQRVGKGDAEAAEAAVELIARRCDPPMTVEAVGELTMNETAEVMTKLSRSLESIQHLDSLITEALKATP